jgi:hypothetical protein
MADMICHKVYELLISILISFIKRFNSVEIFQQSQKRTILRQKQKHKNHPG